jgi:DNA-binding TFAR19-related protein (PDSD5 family)
MLEAFPNNEFLINRAEQCRSIARQLLDPMVRDRMIDLALGYEKIAKAAARLKIEGVKIGRLDS